MNFIVCVVLSLLLFWVCWLAERKEKQKKHYKELAKNYTFCYESIESIEKRFKNDPELLKEAEKLFAQSMEDKKRYKELDRKRGIVERVFAYDYEDLLFQIYAPVATENYFHVWDAYDKYLTRGQILDRISEIRAISIEEADKTFQILKEHFLIVPYGQGFCLTHMLEADRNISPSWNIVSYTDMNLDKWMVAHGYKHTEKSKDAPTHL